MNWLSRNALACLLISPGIYTYIHFSVTEQWPELANQWPLLVIVTLLVFTGAVLLHAITPVLNKLFPWNERRGLRFISEILAGYLIFGFLAAGFFTWFLASRLNADDPGITGEGATRLAIIGGVILFVNALIKFSLFSYNQYAVVQIRNLQISRDQAGLRFEALKSQLNPHFLFNSMNTISYLAYTNSGLAEKYIRKLASTFQFLLEADGRSLIGLKEELKIVKAFFFMQQIKYGEKVSLDIRIDDEIKRTSIPPLTLQLLVENALKHNYIGEAFPLKIRIYADDEHVSVSNNINKFPGRDKTEIESFSIGLENIRKRYGFFTSSAIQIDHNGAFVVRLPLLNNQAHG